MVRSQSVPDIFKRLNLRRLEDEGLLPDQRPPGPDAGVQLPLLAGLGPGHRVGEGPGPRDGEVAPLLHDVVLPPPPPLTLRCKLYLRFL